MFANCCALLGDDGSLRQISGRNFNACIEFLLYVPKPWRSIVITRVSRRSFAEILAHVSAAQICASRKHRARGLKSLVGP